MSEADMIDVQLPEKYNYEIWQDSSLDISDAENIIVPKPILPSQDTSTDQENVPPSPSSVNVNAFTSFHAFSPFKALREARALKSLDVDSFKEYENLKGKSFLIELSRKIFKKAPATKRRIFHNLKEKSF